VTLLGERNLPTNQQRNEQMNIKPISTAVRSKIDFAILTCNYEELEKLVERAWKRHLPDNGSQLTCSRKFIETIFGRYLTESFIEAEIFDFFGGANDQIVRRF
jgi:hypothetical protein